MELLLNIFWLGLVVPAMCIWRSHSRSCQERGFCPRARAFVLLACVLTLLFPVVSATDDLHPMRPEMEESNPFKRVVKAGANGYSGVRLPACVCLFIFGVGTVWILPGAEVRGLVFVLSFIFPEQAVLRSEVSRAPPSICLV